MAKSFLKSVAVVSLAMAPMAAHAEMDSTVQQANALLQDGKGKQAYALLAPQAKARAGDPDFDLALGIAATDSGRYAEAIIALQRVMAVQPTNARAQAELGRAYAKAGDVDTARAEFRTVLNDPTVPDPVRRRIDGLVRDLDSQAGAGGVELTGFADLTGGYDSNANSATDATSITIPAFAVLGPATLNGPAREQDDEFYQLQGGLSLAAPLSRQTRLFGSVLGNYRDNFDLDFVDQASLTGTVGVSHKLLNGDVVSLSGQAQRFWLDDDGYRTVFGAIGQYTKRLSDDRALALALQYFRLDYDGSPLQDADRYAVAITYADRNIYAGIGGGKEETVRDGADQLSNLFVNAQVGGEFAVAPRLAAIGGLGVEYRNHDDQDPLFLRSREDWQFDAALGLRYAITDAISVRPRVTYTRNESDLALYDYDRTTASVGVRYDF